MFADLRYALRQLRKSPAFTLVAILTLALGVGANTAIFSVVKAVLLDQLPYRDPGRMVKFSEASPDTPLPETIDYTTTYDLRQRSRSFESMSLFRDGAGAIVEQGQPELIEGMRVGYDYFDTLGVKMLLGRGFLAEEDQPETRYEIVLTHGLWLRRFGGDPAIVGRTIRMSDRSYKVVGVLPENFFPLVRAGRSEMPEMYAPLGYDLKQPMACRGCQHLQVVGRLKPGVSMEQARAELNSLLREIVREHPTDYDESTVIAMMPLRDYMVARVSTALWILLGAVGMVLLIACANVAHLALARATSRTKEMALRAALGAGRARLARQLLGESIVLALIGGLAGLVLAWWGTSILATLGLKELPRAAEIRVDLPILLFTLATSILTGLLFGVVPALRTSQVDPNEALKDAGRATEARSRHAYRNMLITVEIALAFVLVMGAGLLGKSLLRLLDVDAGYDPHNVLTAGVYVYGDRYDNKPQVELNFYQQAMQRLRVTPGIEGVAMVSTLPLATFDRRGLHIQDRPLANESEGPAPDTYSISPEYFSVMRIPLKRGRLFTGADRAGAPGVAIISESCARAVFPNEDPIGKHVQLGGRDDKKPWLTIVGIVGDVRQYSFDRPSQMEAYVAQAQNMDYGFDVVVRTGGDPRRFEQTVRQAFLAADNTQPIYQVRPLEDYVAESQATRRFSLMLLGLFGALALVLAVVGIYGVISYAVSLRTRELGIRLALGAERRAIIVMVLRQGLAVVAGGLAVGLAASLVLTRSLVSLLFEVRPLDLATLTGVTLILAAIALLANYLPARRASRVDPVVALRYE
ncbi:MAG TPA: ABC transporter permease [Terriglobales bacterium]|jgi:putative ABC transport system permease protein|nr:ABC transporter permease [Terriglobales bacterium]